MALGHYGELTVEQARKQAQRLLGQVAIGIDPVAEKRRTRHEAITLTKAYQDFKAALFQSFDSSRPHLGAVNVCNRES